MMFYIFKNLQASDYISLSASVVEIHAAFFSITSN
jgi:hypothetical protein